MYIITKNAITSSLHFIIARSLHKSHYEILQVPRNCTLKEIKHSYIKLSKKYHPDTSNEAQSQKRFVEVTEAYQVLSKPDLRRNYDLGLSNSGTDEYGHPTNEAFYRSREKYRDEYYNPQPYYGIKGLKRVSNFYIVLLCLGFTSIGVGLQVLAIRHSYTLRRDNMIKVSDSAGLHLKKVREQAEKNGNKLQIEIMRKKFEDEANVHKANDHKND